MNIKGCLSHESDHWATPSYIYEQVKALGMFDPCPLHSSFDGLAIDWGERCFVNPPYSKLLVWVRKCIEQSKKGKRVTMLIPARTDTKAFKALWEHGSKFTFVTGRLHFNDSKPAPFPSMIVDLFGGGNSICFLVNREDIRLE